MQTHPIQIGTVRRELKVVNVGEVSVALLNLLGDSELTEAAAQALGEVMPAGVETLVTPEVKAVPLAHAISVRTGIPYVVARKSEKPYMVDAVKKSVKSITTGDMQTLVIDGANISQIKDHRVAIIDDVVSTGGTLRSLTELIGEIGGEVVATLAVFTEGETRDGVTALGHLPLYDKEAGV